MSMPVRLVSVSRKVTKRSVRFTVRWAKAVSSSSSRARPVTGRNSALSVPRSMGMFAANPAGSPMRRAITHSVAAMEISSSMAPSS